MIRKFKKLLRIIAGVLISIIVRMIWLVLYPWRSLRVKRFYCFRNSIRQILIIFLGEGLGDCILFSAALPAIRERFKEAKLNLLIFERFREYFSDNPYIERLFVYSDYRYSKNGFMGLLKYGRALRRYCRADILLELLPNRFIKPAILSSLLPKRLSIGFDYSIKKLIYDIAIKIDWDKFFYDAIFDALKPLGIKRQEPQYWVPPPSSDQSLSIKSDFKGKTVILAPGGKFNLLRPQDYQGFKYYPELVTHLVGEGYRVILVGAEYDKDLRFSKNKLPKDRFIDLIGKTSLKQLFSLIKDYADLVVCNNTGVLHTSVALGIPTVSYAHPLKNLKRWRPYPNDGRHKVLQETLLKKVTIDEFLRAIRESLSAKNEYTKTSHIDSHFKS